MSGNLESFFGPDSGTLLLRIGIHSGAVTGGYLQGQGQRFQIFGDTVNTALHLASSGIQGRIQVSSETAKLLIHAGKERWLEKRTETTINSGQQMQTYWVKQSSAKTICAAEANDDCDSVAEHDFDSRYERRRDGEESIKSRLVDWNVDVLHRLIVSIVQRRSVSSMIVSETLNDFWEKEGNCGSSSSDTATDRRGSTMPLLEVKEIIYLPEFDGRAAGSNDRTVQLSENVRSQLKDFVGAIANMYNDNPFHNFSHASHVVMAVTKFMNRIKEARELEIDNETKRTVNAKKLASVLHHHTFGITSDPLTQLACVFSALIHDVDHPGVPNAQLIKENKDLASRYSFRSVAEQNSVDLAWGLLTDEHFKDLLTTICATKGELLRFRQIVVNSVMATDLGDKELKDIRNNRWDRAFGESESTVSTDKSSVRKAVNRKATIVIEHLIQAADVAHTSQHWEVYRIWNENLFREIYKAYIEGRATQDPSGYWYEGEIAFFDFYIIPLAKKLRDCGVFGLTSEENLNYANQNRQLWIELGNGIVAEMLDKAKEEFDPL